MANSQIEDTPHIGAAHHRGRAAWWTAGIVAAAVILFTSHTFWVQHNAAAVDKLSVFESAYMTRCDDSAFPAQTAGLTKKLYLGSSMLQRTVDHELSALEAGASCNEVFHALRDADFPMSTAPHAEQSAPL